MSFSGLFQTQGMLFLLLLIGYIFGKKGLADGTGKNLLTDLVILLFPEVLSNPFRSSLTTRS